MSYGMLAVKTTETIFCKKLLFDILQLLLSEVSTAYLLIMRATETIFAVDRQSYFWFDIPQVGGQFVIISMSKEHLVPQEEKKRFSANPQTEPAGKVLTIQILWCIF